MIVTTLAMASYFVGLAGTKVNKAKKKCKSFKENLQRSLKSRKKVAVRTQEVQADNSRRRAPRLPVGSLAPSRQTARNQRSLQALELAEKLKKNTAATASRPGGRRWTRVAERARVTPLKLPLRSTDSGSDLLCSLGTFSPKWAKNVSAN